jgi:hypothetical protein
MFGLPQLPRTLGAALRDIVHERPHVRHSAQRDLVRLSREAESRESAVAALARALRSDPSAELRAAAALALADVEGHEARDALHAALDDAHLEVKKFATLALGEVAAAGDTETITRLERLGRADEPALRFQALVALERLSPESLDGVLERAAGDADDEVRAMAFRIAERRWFEPSTAPAWALASARRALGGGGNAVRAAAAFFLAAQGEADALSVVEGVLDGSVPASGDDVQAAIEIATEHRLERARPALARRAFGPFGVRSDPIAWHALVALARLDDDRARRAILKKLDAWSVDARTLAVAAAGRAGLGEARARIESFRDDPRKAAPEAVAEALRALAAGD